MALNKNKSIDFSKMEATGNDFVVLDARALSYTSRRLSTMAKKLSARKTGIGANGLLVLEKSKKADFRMRIFNPDGTEPDMCGNGSRCIALYAKSNNIAGSSMSIETGAGLLNARVSGCDVKINMTRPKDIRLDIKLNLHKKPYNFHYINTGVPHVVCFVRRLNKFDMELFGRRIRYHNIFMPQGVNVNIVELAGKSSISIRTYERGVEAETLACGTGSVASALITALINGYSPPVKVKTRGGDLAVYFNEQAGVFDDVFLAGKARLVFKGSIKI
jgi:diaminopimelate epimerase